MTARPQELQRRLAAIVGELEKLSLPAGRDGSTLLDTLEATERVRQMIRARAKARLSKEPNALPGWQISLANGRARREGPEYAPGSHMVIRQQNRVASIKLVRRRLHRKGAPAPA
jgi:hypothetical protein